MRGMKEVVAQQLFDLNGQFYQSFGRAFAETRRRIQPGVRRVLHDWISSGDWLDLGCGSGVLGVEWAKTGLQGSYLGLDFSRSLLEEAQKNLAGTHRPEYLSLAFKFADLRSDDWLGVLPEHPMDGVLMFAALHHIPGSGNRLRLLQQIHQVIQPQGVFIHSEWQFQNSPKLMARIKPWNLAGIDPADLEEGDTLLDWRHAAAGQDEHQGLRYVHLFSHEELLNLAQQAGFDIEQEFYSDGAGEKLGLYQLWRRN